MSQNKNPFDKITAFSYKNFSLLIDTLRNEDNLISEIVRVHLVSEYLLEELIRFSFNERADAILSIGLRYQQKLDLVSKLKFIDDVDLLPHYIVGSLRKLNRLRNRVAHRLNEAVTDDEVKDLFMGLEDELPYHDMEKIGSVTMLKRFLAFLYGSLLPKYEQSEE